MQVNLCQLDVKINIMHLIDAVFDFFHYCSYIALRSENYVKISYASCVPACVMSRACLRLIRIDMSACEERKALLCAATYCYQGTLIKLLVVDPAQRHSHTRCHICLQVSPQTAANPTTSADLGLNAPAPGPETYDVLYGYDSTSRLPELPAISALNLPPLPAQDLPRGDGYRWVPGVAPGLPPTQEDPESSTFQALTQVVQKTFLVRIWATPQSVVSDTVCEPT